MRLSVRIPDELAQEVEASGKPASQLVRDALALYFDFNSENSEIVARIAKQAADILREEAAL